MRKYTREMMTSVRGREPFTYRVGCTTNDPFFTKKDFKPLPKNEGYLIDGIFTRNKDFTRLKLCYHKKTNTYWFVR